MKTNLKTGAFLTVLAFAPLTILAWASTLQASQMSGADSYISKASSRLKTGRYQGQNSNHEICSVDVKLERQGKTRKYEVEIQPTLILENASNAPTVVTFHSSDTRVLFDAQIVRAVSNSGENYMILAIENLKGGKTRIRGYNEKNRTVRSSDCTVLIN